MRAHATRTTCFAIISAIENDLRALVRRASDSLQLTTILPVDVRLSAEARWLKDDRSGIRSHAEDDFELLNYIDFLDLSKILHTSFRSSQNIISVNVSALAGSFERLAPTRNRVCHTPPLEVDDLPTCVDVAHSVLAIDRPSFPTLDQTLASLKDDPTSLLHISIPSFWYSDLIDKSQWESLAVGATVVFRVGENKEGPCAVAIRLA